MTSHDLPTCAGTDPSEPCWGSILMTYMMVATDEGPHYLYLCDGHQYWPSSYLPESGIDEAKV